MPASSLPASFPDAAGDIGAPAALALDLDLDLEDLALGGGGGGGGADCIGRLSCGRRSSFSYRRLPEPRLRLTVQKLDDSFFDIETARSATVWELKLAIENLFSALYDDAHKTISWNQVWSHFCLCFKDERLTDDKATLRGFGIRDGDVLHFAQHLSVDYSPCRSLPKYQKEASHTHRRSRTSLDGYRLVSLLDDLSEDEGEKITNSRCSTSVLEDPCVFEYNEVLEERVEEETPKKGGLFHRWFSSSKLRSNRRTHAEDTVPLSSDEKKKNAHPKLGKWLTFKF